MMITMMVVPMPPPVMLPIAEATGRCEIRSNSYVARIEMGASEYALRSLLGVSLGYAVLSVNPRGSTSYGEEFANLIHHAYPGRDYDDLMAAVDAVAANAKLEIPHERPGQRQRPRRMRHVSPAATRLH